MILAVFDLQVTPIPPAKLRFKWPFGSGEKVQIDFRDGRHGGNLGYLIGTILVIFDLQVTLILPVKL